MDTSRYSGIGRPMDFSYTTNRIITWATALIFAGGTVLQFFSGETFLPALGWGFGVAITVFLTWALVREIDPDHDVSAFLGAGFTLIGSFLFFPPDFLILIWLLFITRMVNQSTGIPARVYDSVLISILTAVLIFWKNYWLLGFGSGIFFLYDAFLTRGNRKQYLFAILQFLMVAAGLLFADFRIYTTQSPPWLILAVIATGIFTVPLIVSYQNVRSTSDTNNLLLSSSRIQALQVTLLILLMLFTLRGGTEHLQAVMPVWAALAGALFYKYIRFAIPQKTTGK